MQGRFLGHVLRLCLLAASSRGLMGEKARLDVISQPLHQLGDF